MCCTSLFDLCLDSLTDVVRCRTYENLDLTWLENPAVCLHIPVCKFAYRELESYSLGLATLESDSVECLELLERTLYLRINSLHVKLSHLVGLHVSEVLEVECYDHVVLLALAAECSVLEVNI